MVYAAGGLDFIPPDPFGIGDITPLGIMGIVVNVLIGVSISVGTIAIIVSGIQFLMSQGDAKAIDTARRYLSVAVVALILGLAAVTIKTIVVNTIGATGV